MTLLLTCSLSMPATVLFAAVQKAACVNPGGSCNGSVPCCDSHNNACFRGICQPVRN